VSLAPRRPLVHPAASRGFGAAADAYERGRPSYPEASIAFLTERLTLGPGRSVLELGAGTGRFTTLLVRSGAEVIATEPVAAMRERLAELPDVSVLGAVAESLPIRGASIDAVVAAQAFHWFDPTRAFAEVARVLRSGGLVALVWNVRDERVGWVRALSDLIEPYRGDTPAHRSFAWVPAAEESAAFGPIETAEFPYSHRTTREGVVDRIASISFIATLPEHDRERALDGVRRVVANVSPVGSDGAIAFPYRTEVHVLARR
jgi:SAM-dependent methyltransferase